MKKRNLWKKRNDNHNDENYTDGQENIQGMAGFCSCFFRKILIFKNTSDPGCLNDDRCKINYPLRIIEKMKCNLWVQIIDTHIFLHIYEYIELDLELYNQWLCHSLHLGMLLKENSEFLSHVKKCLLWARKKEEFRKILFFIHILSLYNLLLNIYVCINNVWIFHNT